MQADFGLETEKFTMDDFHKLVLRDGQPDLLMLCKLARSPRKTIRDAAYRFMNGGRTLAENESRLKADRTALVGGADEVGRGALAGPITAACVVMKQDVVIDGIADSKSLTGARRRDLYCEIASKALQISITFIDNSLIDNEGIQHANIKALRDSITGMEVRCGYVICDHFTISNCKTTTYGIPKADTMFQSVAAASIVAKVERDRIMERLDDVYPDYGFRRNKGYGTREHTDALARCGPCDIHRFSFRGVGQIEGPTLWERQIAGG